MAFNLWAALGFVEQEFTAVELDGAELAGGANVEVPGKLTVGSTSGKPVYLFGVLSTNPNFSVSTDTVTPAAAASVTVKGA
jgi:hypothetical protein